MNYYNENDPSAAAWIMELIRAGVVPDGQLDTRSICDVQPEDLNGFDQCHFFGGILGWPEALRIAGYAGMRGLWTGSCPCQPFSAAGKRKGTADARHLWPEMFRLVKAARPQYVIGEQVEAAIRLGWLDGVFGDLEGEGYACGAAVLGAHSVGAPHIRQRLYWGAARLADTELRPTERHGLEVAGTPGGAEGGAQEWQRVWDDAGDGEFVSDGLEHPTSDRRDGRRPEPSGRGAPVRCGEDTIGRVEFPTREQVGIPGQPREQRDAGGRVADAEDCDGRGEQQTQGTGGGWPGSSRGCEVGGLGDPDDPRPQGYGPVVGERAGELSPWAASTVIPCADGKTRRISVEPEFQHVVDGLSDYLEYLRPESLAQEEINLTMFPLAANVSGRVGLLRGYGNAIVPAVAAEFIVAFMESANENMHEV